MRYYYINANIQLQSSVVEDGHVSTVIELPGVNIVTEVMEALMAAFDIPEPKFIQLVYFVKITKKDYTSFMKLQNPEHQNKLPDDSKLSS